MSEHPIEILFDRPIAFYRVFVTVSGSVNAALMLSQAIYWSRRTSHADKWFYKNREEWEDETGLSRSEQETARRKLVELGVLFEKRQGMPAQLWFRVDLHALSEILKKVAPRLQASHLPVGGNPANKLAGKSPTASCTESTTENTTTEGASAPAPSFPAAGIKEIWNRVVAPSGFSAIHAITGKRAKSVAARWKECPDLATWETYFKRVAGSTFLRGRTGKGKHPDWQASIEFITSPTAWAKLIEGQYDDTVLADPPTTTPTPRWAKPKQPEPEAPTP